MASIAQEHIERRAFGTLGGGDFGWLNGHHHFVVGGDAYDPNRLNWGALRVLNDDIVQPGGGFQPHRHQDMEIISYVLGESLHPATNKLEGGVGLKHQDDTGSGAIIEPGDVQVMAAGSDGVIHSETHPGGNKTVNFLQIWLLPSVAKRESSWGTRHFPKTNRTGRFVVLASGFKEDQPEALAIHAYSRVAGATVGKGEKVEYHLGKERLGYLVSANARVTVNGITIEAHDGVAIKNTEVVTVTSGDGPAEVLLVDTQ